MERVAYFVAMPYIREGLQTLSTRLGMDAITLGLLHQGDVVPSRASIRRQKTGEVVTLGQSGEPTVSELFDDEVSE
jgi:hypothetical protein